MFIKKALTIILLFIFSYFLISCNNNTPEKNEVTADIENSEEIDKSAGTIKIDTYSESSLPISYSVTDKNSAEILFSVTKPFCGIEFFCSVENNENQSVSCSLYSFDTDLKTTVETEKPLLKQEFDNISNDSWLMLKFKDKPAGNYLFVINKGTKYINLLSDTPSPFLENKILNFYNKIKIETGAYRFRVLFNDKINDNTIDIEQYFDFPADLSKTTKN